MKFPNVIQIRIAKKRKRRKDASNCLANQVKPTYIKITQRIWKSPRTTMLSKSNMLTKSISTVPWITGKYPLELLSSGTTAVEKRVSNL